MKCKKIIRKINDGFQEALHIAFKDKFGVALVTWFNIIEMRYVTEREDEQPLTQEQHAFIEAFEKGYLAARQLAEDATG